MPATRGYTVDRFLDFKRKSGVLNKTLITIMVQSIYCTLPLGRFDILKEKF